MSFFAGVLIMAGLLLAQGGIGFSDKALFGIWLTVMGVLLVVGLIVEPIVKAGRK